MELEEAENIARRLLNERRAIERIEEVLSTARECEANRDALVEEVESLERARNHVRGEVEQLQFELEKISQEYAEAKAEHEKRLRVMQEELEIARQQHAQILQEMHDREETERARLEAAHREVIERMNNERRRCEDELSMIRHELEATRLKMQRLIENG